MTSRVWLGLGLFTLAAAWLGGFNRLLPGPFAAHMTAHMAVVAVAAPLLSLAVAGGRFDPARRMPALFAPIPASILELVLVWGWHAPLLHQAARASTLAFALEQGSFLASGSWLWLSAIGGTHERRGAGLVALLLTSMHMTLLGALLALSPRALYAHGAHSGHGGHSISLAAGLEDQHLGGAIMIVLGGFSYLVGGLWLAAGVLRRTEARVSAVGSAATVGEAADPVEKA